MPSAQPDTPLRGLDLESGGSAYPNGGYGTSQQPLLTGGVHNRQIQGEVRLPYRQEQETLFRRPVWLAPILRRRRLRQPLTGTPSAPRR